ncbi:MAG: response regulator, partial [Nevskiales bacterium]
PATAQVVMHPAAAGGRREEIGSSTIARALSGMRVLLVEDNAMNRRLASEILGDAGVQLTTAEDGEHALTALAAGDYDAVLMDVQMPVMDGFEATRRIRLLPGYSDLPVIAMTANAFQEDREQALAAGMNDFLAKPIDSEQLLEKLSQWKRSAVASG